MRIFIFSIIILVNIFANSKFESNQKCKDCHPLIYEEYQKSMHANATIFKDPIHKAVWDKHPAKKKESYKCAKCHTPAADNLKELMAPKNGILPDPNNNTQNDGISCAYCHRIKEIKIGLRNNTNIISNIPKKYFGTRKDHIKSPFHEIDTTNKEFLKGNVCMGCHSHNRNKFGLNVCSTNENQEIENSNCVSCHMPKVKGSVSNLRETKNHTFHGFAGTHFHNHMLKKYVDIEFLPKLKSFEIAVNSKAPHALLLHPLRVAFLNVEILRKDKKVFEKKEIFVRIIGANKKPTPPWLAKEVVKDTMIKGNEKRVLKYDFKLQKGDKIVATLGYKLVNPKMLKKLNLEKIDIAKKTFILKREVFKF